MGLRHYLYVGGGPERMTQRKGAPHTLRKVSADSIAVCEHIRNHNLLSVMMLNCDLLDIHAPTPVTADGLQWLKTKINLLSQVSRPPPPLRALREELAGHLRRVHADAH